MTAGTKEQRIDMNSTSSAHITGGHPNATSLLTSLSDPETRFPSWESVQLNVQFSEKTTVGLARASQIILKILPSSTQRCGLKQKAERELRIIHT